MFNANDYTTRQLIEMELKDLSESEEKENFIAEALQYVEIGYTLKEAVSAATELKS